MIGAVSIEWIRKHLPSPPARLIEIGAGDGVLAAQLRIDGYEVLAIDPREEVADGVQQVALLDLDAPAGSFDAAISQLSLHHLEPLDGSLTYLAALLRPGATLVVDEFDVAAFDRRAAAWLLARWHEQGREIHGDAGAFQADVRDHLHPIDLIVDRLASAGFDVGPVERGPYLHRWHVEPGLLDDEQRRIDAGELPATGARFTATRR